MYAAATLVDDTRTANGAVVLETPCNSNGKASCLQCCNFTLVVPVIGPGVVEDQGDVVGAGGQRPTEPANGKRSTPGGRMSAQFELGTEELEWHRYANCLGVDPDLFFPERGASTREAKEVCRGCVVREQCLEFALTNGEKFGIWGGMSERERRRIRRQRAAERREGGAQTA